MVWQRATGFPPGTNPNWLLRQFLVYTFRYKVYGDAPGQFGYH
jgi:hypothetical protein